MRSLRHLLCSALTFFAIAATVEGLQNYERRSDASPDASSDAGVTPIVLVLAHDRTSHLRRVLRSISSVTPDALRESLSVIVSVDDNRRARQ